MNRRETILEKLDAVTNDEWYVVMAKCEEHIHIRLRGRTNFGAHCEKHLGMPAFDYYFPRAVEKLYSKDGWDWKFEEFTLLEQIIRIINSMISWEVEKYKGEKERNPIVISKPDEEMVLLAGGAHDEPPPEELMSAYLNEVQLIKEIIDGDDDLELLFLYLDEGNSYDEICAELEWEKKKLYKLAEKLKRKVFSHKQKRGDIL